MSEYKSVVGSLSYAVQYINPQVMKDKVFGAASDSADGTTARIFDAVVTHKPEVSWRVEWYVRHLLAQDE